jgi:uncharacterized protein
MSVDDAIAEPEGLSADDVESFLRAHPQFLTARPELLAVLQVPHDIGGAASLVEYQVRVLRERNRELTSHLELLLANARDNEAVSERLHRLAVILLGVHSVTDLFAETYASLSEDFRADCVAIRIFGTPADGPGRGCGEFVGQDGPRSHTVTQMLAARQPVCGVLDEDTAGQMFGERGGLVASAALVPLGADNFQGVLAIGSFDEKRFSSASGTHFLTHLGALVAHGVARFTDGDLV